MAQKGVCAVQPLGGKKIPPRVAFLNRLPMILACPMQLLFCLLRRERAVASNLQPHRMRMAHNLIVNYHLYKHMEVFVRRRTILGRILLCSALSCTQLQPIVDSWVPEF